MTSVGGGGPTFYFHWGSIIFLRANFYFVEIQQWFAKEPICLGDLFVGTQLYYVGGGEIQLHLCFGDPTFFYVGVPTFDLGVQLYFRGIKLFLAGEIQLLCVGELHFLIVLL